MTSAGTTPIPEVRGALPPTPTDEIDARLDRLRRGAERWARREPGELLPLLDRLLEDTAAEAERWVDEAVDLKRIDPSSPAVAEEWLTGPWLVLRNLRLLRRSLEDLAAGRMPRIPGDITLGPHGGAVAGVFPAMVHDRLFFPGFTGEVWMEEGITPEVLADHQAAAYRREVEPAVTLVLGAGNVTSIAPTDALYVLFVERRAVVLKTNPVNEAVGPVLERALRALVEEGVLAVVYGGAAEGDYLCRHDGVDAVHLTGSDATHDAIVWGTGEEGSRRRRERRPRLDKPITSELGNVSPVIVVPGPWSEGDLRHQGEGIAAQLVNNAGCNCNAARVIVQQRGWRCRGPLLDEVGERLAATPVRPAYYPGSEERWQRFVDAHPEARRFGSGGGGTLPWTVIPGVDPERHDDIALTVEAFTGVMSETALDAADPPSFLAAAVDFCNDVLWGSLNATLLVHPESMKDAATATAVERAVAELRYGTVAINVWAGIGFGMMTTTWGAHPGHELHDIRSGRGTVHNTLMFDRPLKSVIRAPFRVRPKPPWFPSHDRAVELARRITAYEAEPSPLRLPGIVADAVRG